MCHAGIRPGYSRPGTEHLSRTCAMSSTGLSEYLPKVDMHRGHAVTILSGDAAVRFARAFSVIALRLSKPKVRLPRLPPQQILSFLFLAASTSSPAADSFAHPDPAGEYQPFEIFRMMYDFDSRQTVVFPEYPVADRAGKKQCVSPGIHYDFSILLHKLCRLFQSPGHKHGPSAAQTAVLVHKFVFDSGLFQYRSRFFAYYRSQRSHTSCKVENFLIVR